VQLDPVNVVARSHLLVLWSRLGPFDPADVDTLLWRERWLFEYWAHSASIVLTEAYPIHRAMMVRYPVRRSSEGRRIHAWLEANDALRRHILDRLRAAGPLPTGGFEDRSAVGWRSGGWTSGRNVERMLGILWFQGQVMVAGRERGGRVWGLAERCLPDWADRTEMPPEEVVARAAEHALRALGVARAADIERHFTRGRYPGLADALGSLERAGRIRRAKVEGGPEAWYVHQDVLARLDDAWQPRTTVISPFDNLICDRERTERLWGFTFRNEMYVPKAKRQYGSYVMPILSGDRLIGRVAPRMDRRRGLLAIEGVFAEPGAPAGEETAAAIAWAIAELGAFTGAREITFGPRVWPPWETVLRKAAGS
jgi:uncharacterized protein